ncbi:MAG: GDSL-type esterase/lipase family protein, partial [Candidatus Binataceae bacterium]
MKGNRSKLTAVALAAVSALLVLAAYAASRRVVFMGDSITEFWGRPSNSFFMLEPGFTDKGIHGQTSGQMLARFQHDVIDEHPHAVVILAGLNDLSVAAGDAGFKMATGNIQRMAEQAKANGVQVVIGSVLPIDPATRVGRMYHTPEEIPAINT